MDEEGGLPEIQPVILYTIFQSYNSGGDMVHSELAIVLKQVIS